MKKISMSLLLLSSWSGLSAMEEKDSIPIPSMLDRLSTKTIQIPATTIRERLKEMYLNKFLEKTHIDKTLGDRPLYPVGFVLGVDNEIALYLKDIRKRSNNPEFITQSSNFMMKMNPLIVKAILKDHPAEIEILIQEDFLEGESNKELKNI